MSFDLSENRISGVEDAARNFTKAKAGILPILAAAVFPVACVAHRDQAKEELQQKAMVEALYVKLDKELAREVEARISKAVYKALTEFTREELASLVQESVAQVAPKQLKIEDQHFINSVTERILGRISADNKLSVALASWQRDPQILKRTMLEPTVQISIGFHVGSGVIIKKEKTPESNNFKYYILSCWHTFRDEIGKFEKDLTANNSLETKSEVKEPQIEVKVYIQGEPATERAKIVYSKADKDLSLLVMSSAFDLPVANFSMDYRESKVQVFSPVVAIGCPLGNDPIPTMGIVSDMAQRHEDFTYMMTTAATHIGNSGGPIFSLETGEIEAIVSKVYMSGRESPGVISHMGLAVPREQIYDFLRDTPLFK